MKRCNVKLHRLIPLYFDAYISHCLQYLLTSPATIHFLKEPDSTQGLLSSSLGIKLRFPSVYPCLNYICHFDLWWNGFVSPTWSPINTATHWLERRRFLFYLCAHFLHLQSTKVKSVKFILAFSQYTVISISIHNPANRVVSDQSSINVKYLCSTNNSHENLQKGL